MSKILVLAEREWLGKIFFNFFVLIGWRTHYLKSLKKDAKTLRRFDAVILTMKSKRQILSDVNKIKKVVSGLRIVCATVNANSALRSHLKSEGITDFFTHENGFLFDKELKRGDMGK